MSESSENDGKKAIFNVEVEGISYEVYLPDFSSDYIQGKIATEHIPYEFEMLKNMAAQINQGSLVLDVGANIGNHTLYLAAEVGCQVYAFEPNESLVEAFEESININGFDDLVTVCKFGLGKSLSHGAFEKEIPENIGAQRIAVGSGDIEIKPLDKIVFDEKVDAIKIDVEGMELDVLMGARELVIRDKPLLYVECQTEESFKSIYAWIKPLGYRYDETFNVTPTHLFVHDEKESQGLNGRDPLEAAICKIYQLENKNIELKKAYDSSNKKYREANARIDNIKEKLTLESVKLSKRMSSQQEMAVVEERVFELEEELTIALERLQKSLENCKSLEQDTSNAESQIESLKRNVEDLTDANSASIKSNQELSLSLNKANNKYREVTRKSIPALKEKLDQENKKVSGLQSDLKKVNGKRLAAEKRVAEIRSSMTFKLGYQIRSAGVSWKKVVKLPLAIWRIYKQGKKREQKRREKLAENLSVGQEGFSPPAVNEKDREHVPPRLLSKVKGSAENIQGLELLANKPMHDINMACIVDDFTFNSYTPECNLIQLTPKNWAGELSSCRPDLLFIESAWRGKDELWGGKVSHKSQELIDVVQWCNDNDVPTVFWNKEDPVHFETFLNTAKLFNWVFTTDIDCIQRYKAALGHDRVYLLPFACQPTINNPLEKYQRKDAFCFAGAYYVRYPERTADLENFITELPKFAPLEIYDRNYNKNDKDYQFPEAYLPYIVGTLPFSEISKAYKGYRYAINLNSIKQSQSMFARRVFELLASNTLTISNYSRGLRLLFGDLVITTDSGREAVRQLKSLSDGSGSLEKIRLAGLRKVMLEHTYRERFAYVLSKVGGKTISNTLPAIKVFSPVKSLSELSIVVESFQRQNTVDAQLTLVLDGVHLSDAESLVINHENIRCIELEKTKNKAVNSLTGKSQWTGLILPDDYYGPNYLLDLVLATRYSFAKVIGKATFFSFDNGAVACENTGSEYQAADALMARSAIVSVDTFGEQKLGDWLVKSEGYSYTFENQLAVDSYNYCRNGGANERAVLVKATVDEAVVDVGIGLDDLTQISEAIEPMPEQSSNNISFGPEDLAKMFSTEKVKAITSVESDKGWELESKLPDGKHEYIYNPSDFSRKELESPAGDDSEIKFHLEMDPGLHASVVLLFLDKDKQRISHVIKVANRNHTVEVPFETEFIRMGLRIYSGGVTVVKGLQLAHRNLEPSELLGQSETLLLTNHYPSYSDLYRNGFVHSRIRAYKTLGIDVDVFRMRKDEPISWHEFQDVDVITGSQGALRRILTGGKYKHVLVHFLDADMWEVLRDFIDEIKVTVWLHGAEIHPWHRRTFNYDSDEKLEVAKAQSAVRMSFWREVLDPMPKNLNLVFVSESFSKEVKEDTGIVFPENQYRIIHNPIDTNLFDYIPKPASQRKKILSIRPFASRQYANDLSVKIILALSEKDYFSELNFLIIGDGVLFEETLAPLKAFKNVSVEKRFLSQPEIASLHKEYGLFLCPTRWDSQGVSRDEAMSSGLIPVTTRIAAIPEFADENSAILGEPESVEEIVAQYDELLKKPEKFLSMSKAASQRVRAQTKREKIVVQEANLFSQSKVEDRINQLKAQLRADNSDEEKYRIYYQLYEVLSGRGFFEEALISLESCIALAPEKADELAGLAVTLKLQVDNDLEKDGIYEDHKNFLKRKKLYQKYPEMVQIETLAACNAACTFCPYPVMDRKGDKMSDELFAKIVEDLKEIPSDHKFTISLNHINEPLADSRWSSFLALLESQLPNAMVTIISNGYLLNEKNINKLKAFSNVESIQVSLNEIDEEAHNSTMKMKGKFNKILGNLDYIHKLRSSNEINFKVFLRRVGDYSSQDKAFIDYCSERWPVFSAASRGLKDFLGQVDSGHEGKPIEQILNARVPITGCTQWFHLVISASGKVAACCFDGEVKWPSGDVSNSSVLDIYSSQYLKSLRDEKLTRLEAEDPCSSCTIHWGGGPGCAVYSYDGSIQ